MTQPANGTVAITGGGANLTYRPDAGYCNSQAGGTADSFTYTLNGGSQATVTVTRHLRAAPEAAAGSRSPASAPGSTRRSRSTRRRRRSAAHRAAT